MRIRTACRSDRDRFATPDQFCSAAAKTPPATQRTLARTDFYGAVPTFHRLNGDAVSDFDSGTLDRKAQRRICPLDDLVIAWDRHSKRGQMLLKSGYVLHATDPKNGVCPHFELL